jgi:serine/threonine protein kinase
MLPGQGTYRYDDFTMGSLPELYGRPWSEEDYVLSLWYYHKHKDTSTHQGSSHVKRLAILLRRNADSVVMRFENFASLEAEQNGRTGLRHIGPEGRKVFDRWKDKLDGLRECAEMIERGRADRLSPPLFAPSNDLPLAFPGYEPEDRLDEGGMADVYTFRRIADGRLFAIKALKEEHVRDSECFSRFKQEIKILKRIRHSRVIQIFDDNLDTERASPAYVMELAERSLRSHLLLLPRDGQLFSTATGARRLPAGEAEEIFTAVCEGVEVLHSHDPCVVHRDINPSNILLMADRGWVIADFGIAKFGSTRARTTIHHTTRRQSWVTGECTAPEQIATFGNVDHRADIYALGVVLFNILVPGEAFYREELPLSDQLRQVIRKATERDPSRRYNTVRELLSDASSAMSDANVQVATTLRKSTAPQPG